MDRTISLIGRKIKELRFQQGLTLEDVADRSDCTPGFISQVERNKAAPSITTLYSIAEALGVKVTDFFPNLINPTKVTYHDRRESFQFEGSAIDYALLTTKFPHGSLNAYLMTIKPENQALPTDEFRAHIGEEFCYILEGILHMWIGENEYDLYPGDNIYFKSTTKHRIGNKGSQPVVAFYIYTPSIF
jgi:transcriptional regulator with XRE-family HTH domain